MAWVTPQTWESGLVTVAMFNEQIRDNLNALKDPPTDFYTVNEGSDYTTTSTSFVDVDATDLALTITTTGGDVLVGFYGTFDGSTTLRVALDVHMDGVSVVGDDGLIRGFVTGSGTIGCIAFVFLVDAPSAGSHTFKLRWRTNTGTATLYAGAAAANGNDVHPQFWVREVS